MWHGKGNKARQVYLASGGAELLEGWLSARGAGAGPLFVPVLKSGKPADRRLAPQSVRYVLQERARAAAVAYSGGVRAFTTKQVVASWYVRVGTYCIMACIVLHGTQNTRRTA